MSGREGSPGPSHERARDLAAMRVDELLPPADDAWLADHLDVCASCAAIASEYEAQHSLFGALRQARPQPPRDLWARTSARIDTERSRARRGGRWGLARRAPGRSARLAVAPVIAVVAVTVIVGAGLLESRHAPPGGVTAAATPMAIQGAADLQVLTVDSAGNLQLLSRRVDQVCPTGVTECGVSPTFDVTAVSPFGTATDLLGAMSPKGDQLVVVRRDPGSQGVYVVPFKRASPSPSGGAAQASAATPRPTPSRAATSPASTEKASSASGSPSASAGHGSASPSSATAEPASPGHSPRVSPASTESPLPSESATIASRTEDVSPKPSISASPSQEGSVPPPSSESPAPTEFPSVEVTPAPDAAIRIASGVTVVGAPTYSPDGSHLAFSAMPEDGSTGPDIYVWAVGDPAALAITTDHDSFLAGWSNAGILVSRVDSGIPTTYTLDPATGQSTAIGEPGTWLPSVSPTGTMAGWWSGTVKLAADGVTWIPDQGRLVLGAWPGAVTPAPTADITPAATADATPTATPTPTPTPTPTATPDVSAASSAAASGDLAATPSQVLAEGPLLAWRVRWDDTGDVVAVWVGRDNQETGRLSLYSVDATTGTPNLANPMLDLPGTDPDFSLRAGRLAWTTSDQGAPQTVGVLAWSGTTVYPPMELPADVSGTVIP